MARCLQIFAAHRWAHLVAAPGLERMPSTAINWCYCYLNTIGVHFHDYALGRPVAAQAWIVSLTRALSAVHGAPVNPIT